jgi:hypothetical protein
MDDCNHMFAEVENNNHDFTLHLQNVHRVRLADEDFANIPRSKQCPIDVNCLFRWDGIPGTAALRKHCQDAHNIDQNPPVGAHLCPIPDCRQDLGIKPDVIGHLQTRHNFQQQNGAVYPVDYPCPIQPCVETWREDVGNNDWIKNHLRDIHQITDGEHNVHPCPIGGCDFLWASNAPKDGGIIQHLQTHGIGQITPRPPPLQHLCQFRNCGWEIPAQDQWEKDKNEEDIIKQHLSTHNLMNAECPYLYHNANRCGHAFHNLNVDQIQDHLITHHVLRPPPFQLSRSNPCHFSAFNGGCVANMDQFSNLALAINHYFEHTWHRCNFPGCNFAYDRNQRQNQDVFRAHYQTHIQKWVDPLLRENPGMGSAKGVINLAEVAVNEPEQNPEVEVDGIENENNGQDDKNGDQEGPDDIPVKEPAQISDVMRAMITAIPNRKRNWYCKYCDAGSLNSSRGGSYTVCYLTNWNLPF